MDQFEKLEENELDQKLLLAGISSGIGLDSASTEKGNQQVMESLFSQLNADERKSFTRLADEMLNMDQNNQSCFRRKQNASKNKKKK